MTEKMAIYQVDFDDLWTLRMNMYAITRKAREIKKRSKSVHIQEILIDEGILDGDYVVIEQQEKAKNGDIVVAILENGFATLKRFFKEATRVRLEPANSQMAPIFAKNVKIQGKVVGVIRRY